MLSNREVVLLDFNDLKIDITERVILGKARNQISIFDITMTHIPTNLTAISDRYRNPHEEYSSEQLHYRLKDTFKSFQCIYRKSENKRIDMDVDEFDEIFDSLPERETSKFDSYNRLMWDFVLNKVKEKTYNKVTEDFVTRDKILQLEASMRQSFESGEISEKCYRIFRNNLIELDLIETMFY